MPPTRFVGGSVWESNPPPTCLEPDAGFEVREAHRDPIRLRAANYSSDQRKECTTPAESDRTVTYLAQIVTIPGDTVPGRGSLSILEAPYRARANVALARSLTASRTFGIGSARTSLTASGRSGAGTKAGRSE